jgi:hypothetical protein
LPVISVDGEHFRSAHGSDGPPGCGVRIRRRGGAGVRASGLVALADQIAGHGLGLINLTLYALASGPDYGSYFYDVTTANNQADPSIPGYPATTGWDPVTGLGTPNAATLVPALARH